MPPKQALVSLACAALAAGAVFAAEPPHWTYDEDHGGPSHWAQLSGEFATCGIGREQSPIDIRSARRADLPPIRFDYRASPLRIIDNGHTIQVNVAPGSAIVVGDDRYQLVQFHFHRPSEERIDGKGFPMVAHLVHRNDAGQLAVIGVLLERGTSNPLVRTLWSRLPESAGKERAADVAIDAMQLLPARRGYFTFAGSLTTPPCSEGVRWFVLKRPATLSAEQIETFARRYPNNARPVQPLNARKVEESASD